MQPYSLLRLHRFHRCTPFTSTTSSISSMPPYSLLRLHRCHQFTSTTSSIIILTLSFFASGHKTNSTPRRTSWIKLTLNINFVFFRIWAQFTSSISSVDLFTSTASSMQPYSLLRLHRFHRCTLFTSTISSTSSMPPYSLLRLHRLLRLFKWTREP